MKKSLMNTCLLLAVIGCFDISTFGAQSGEWILELPLRSWVAPQVSPLCLDHLSQ